MKSDLIVPQQFRGPPNSGNGGYACGLMAKAIGGEQGATISAMLRAPVSLDVALTLVVEGDEAKLLGAADILIGEANRAPGEDLPPPPLAPSLAEAHAAGRRFIGLRRPFHPICFTCGDRPDEGFGLRVFVGGVEGAPGLVAGDWTPHANFADAGGLAPLEIVWAALDCPGSVAWVDGGGGAGLLGTMTCWVRRRPNIGERTIVAAWPIEQSGRKQTSGTALYSADGEVMAVARQIWIARAPAATLAA